MTNVIDDSLIRSSQAGDRSAFERLLELIYDMIYRFALRWSGCVSDAEDITQQACIKLAKVIGQFRFESAFTTWLYRLVINCAKDWSRAQQRHRQTSGVQHIAEAAEVSVSSDGALEASSEITRVLALVDKMGKGFRETLLLVYAEGMSHKEAAEILGLKESTVSWRLHEIKKQLNQHDQQSDSGKGKSTAPVKEEER